MSGEHAVNTGIKTPDNTDKNIKTSTKRVDINVLLDKVRAGKKKEKFENGIFFALSASVIIVTGIIISL